MMGGLAYMTGPSGQPLRAGAPVIDIAAASFGVVAALAALHARERTGRGRHVQAGLFESAVFLLSQYVTQASMSGAAPPPMPSRGMGPAMGWAVYQLFATADGRQLFIAITSNAHWERFCTEFDLPDLFQDASLDTNAKRAANRHRVVPRIEAIARGLTAAELAERLERVSVPYAPLNTPLDLLGDPHLRAAGRLHEVRTADDRTINAPALPVAGDGLTADIRHQPSALGEHTAEILRELGYSDAEITDLIERRVVATGGPTLFSTGSSDQSGR
jgi:crotonobetainyl-CoA:carnitine CoA-transferase CaiB-like acyl-CoA transferase